MSLPITSCLVNGVEMISHMLLLPTRIARESGDRVGTAHLEFLGIPNDIGPYIFPGASVELLSDATSLFSGTINRIEPEAVSKSETLGGGKTQFSVDCQDRMADLAQTIVEDDANYQSGSSSDATIISDMFTAYASWVDLTNVATVAASCRIQIRSGWTLRQLMNELCGRTGAAWNLSGDQLHYAPPTATAAPWGLREYEGTDTIDAGDSAIPGEAVVGAFLPGDPGTGTDIDVFIPLLNGLRFTREWTTPINRVIVRGKAGSGGVRVTSGVVEDTASQTAYGIRSRTVVEDNIQDSSEAADRAAVIISQNAYPQEYCSFAIRLDGLEVGQYINVNLPSLVLENSYYINRISLQWETQTVVTYTVECGFYRPSVIQDTRKALDDVKTPAYVTETIPADGTVTAAKVVSINADQISGTITASQIDTIDISQVTGTITVSASNITGSINFSQINGATVSISNSQLAGSINFSKLDGATVSITGSQIASLTITDGNIANNTISSAKIVSLDVGKLTAGTITASISLNSGGTLDVYDAATFHSQMGVGPSNNYLNVLSSGATFGVTVYGTDVEMTGGVYGASGFNTGASGAYKINGSTIINLLGQFVGNGVDVGSNGVGCGAVNIGGNTIIQGRQTGPGSPSFASLSDAQTWCSNLLTALQTHGLVT